MPTPKKTKAAPPAPPAKSKPAASGAQLSKFQKFEPRRVHRRLLKGAEYNPRIIDDFSKAKLKKKLATRGLLSAIVWNEKTGNVVSGHQRLAILDALEGSDDYLLDVDVVRLSPKQEREENLFFNNAFAMGEWDNDKLFAMVSSDEIKLEETGFGEMDLAMMFEGTEHEAFFIEEEPEEVQQATAAIGEMAAAGKEAREAYDRAPGPADADAPNGRMENGEAIRDPERHAAIIEEREKMREKMKAHNATRTGDYFVVVVCTTREECDALAEGMSANIGLDGKPYVDGRALAHRLKIDLPEPPAEA